MDINKYNLMVPPFEFVPFEKMNKKQAIEVLSRVGLVDKISGGMVPMV